MEEEEFEEPTYTDIFFDVRYLKSQVKSLDDDSLVDAAGALRYNLEGKEFEKLEYIVAKNYADEELYVEEVEFLKDLYIVSHCKYGIIVDDEGDDDDE